MRIGRSLRLYMIGFKRPGLVLLHEYKVFT